MKRQFAKLLILFLVLAIVPISFSQSKKPHKKRGQSSNSIRGNDEALDKILAEIPPSENWVHITDPSKTRTYYDRETVSLPERKRIKLWVCSWPSPEGTKNQQWRKSVIEQRKTRWA